MKSLQTDRENLGIQLYGIQQQLARQQMLMEQEQDNHSAMNQLRLQKEGVLAEVRELYRKMQEQIKEERKQSKMVVLQL